ncbi:DUF5131 family protein [Leptospira andrefontaineae]|uniref:Phage Gp37/Gp68 family protein n=1 Tax=Leptospira andrefontaineae TaxID=2484976 RepID=A0A4R9GXF7_9LEPT|nr:phage Gp37/Gp68 family protein [Leptospira andrefontaineae]TGK36236.1 phage Gp37/Gp68 family protein [Leptospira andrefontaineae]
MQNSKIEWTDHTWNPVTGCAKVSAGCKNCYAETLSKRKFGEWKDRPFSQIRLKPHKLSEPFRIKEPSKIFVNSMSDLFHQDVPFDFVDQVFAEMALNSKHIFQVLTKRPHRMREYLKNTTRFISIHIHMRNREMNAYAPKWPLPNVWLGVSVENQKAADERIPILLECPAAVRFLSCEPLLGEVDLTRVKNGIDSLSGEVYNSDGDFCGVCSSIDWVIVGGESGPSHRPVDPNWIRFLRDQCQEADVPFFFKQWGGARPKERGNELDGKIHQEFPHGI